MDVTVNGKEFPVLKLFRNAFTEEARTHYGFDMAYVTVHTSLRELEQEFGYQLISVTYFGGEPIQIERPIESSFGFLERIDEASGDFEAVLWQYMEEDGHVLQTEPRFRLQGTLSCGGVSMLGAYLYEQVCGTAPTFLGFIHLVDAENLELLPDLLDDDEVRAFCRK